MVGHLLLYHPAIVRAKAMVDAGELGDVLYLYGQRVNLGIVREAENAWWSLAPHDIAVAIHLFGAAPVSVSATGATYLQRDRQIEDVAFAALNFSDGRMAHLHVSWLDPHKRRSLTVVGTRKMLTFDDTLPDEKLKIYDKGASARSGHATYSEGVVVRSGDVTSPALPHTEPLLAECEHFVACVADGTHATQRWTPRRRGGPCARSGRAFDARGWRSGGDRVNAVFVHPSAVVDPGAEIGPGTKIWHFCHVMPGARIGAGSRSGTECLRWRRRGRWRWLQDRKQCFDLRRRRNRGGGIRRPIRRVHEREDATGVHFAKSRVSADAGRAGCHHRCQRDDRLRAPVGGLLLRRRRRRRHARRLAPRSRRWCSRASSGLGLPMRRHVVRGDRRQARSVALSRVRQLVPRQRGGPNRRRGDHPDLGIRSERLGPMRTFVNPIIPGFTPIPVSAVSAVISIWSPAASSISPAFPSSTAAIS